jgi:KDO2-lipid IV(A) lauroyltransferase
MSVARQSEQVRWHLHGLNTGTIFGLTHWGVAHIPRRASYAIGHVGTWLAFHGMKQATSALIDNLRVVLPALDERELRALALRTYRSYARETIDFIRSLSMDRRELAAMLSPLKTRDRVWRGGKGLLLLTGHIGNIELGAVILRAIYQFPLAVVVLPDADPRVNERRQRMRASLGIESLEVRRGMDTALRIRRLLAEDRAVALISDRPLGRDRVEVEFFGRRAGFLRTPALIGYLTGAPLVPSFILRQPDGRYAGLGLDPICVARTGDRDAAVRAAMQEFASALEQIVREYPHLWYQFYPYWGEGNEQSETRGGARPNASEGDERRKAPNS